MSRPAPTAEEKLLPLWLSLTIEADYRSIAAFPGLRIESASKRSGTQLLFYVPVDFAREVLEHAEDRKAELGCGRGLFQAYRSLVERLRNEIDRFEGVQDDPGLEAHEKAIKAMTTHLPAARLTHADGGEVILIEGFSLRRCTISEGRYRDKDGERFDYRPGYVGALHRPGEAPRKFFFAPHELVSSDGGQTHLRLVHSA